MKSRIPIYIVAASLALGFSLTSCGKKEEPGATVTTREERRHVKTGLEHYKKAQFAQAEIENRKALASNPESRVAQFNLASSLSKQAGADQGNQLVQQADSIFSFLAQDMARPEITEKANYNLGNRAYTAEQYQQSIELYKQALRLDPTDDLARQNLRLAQLKLQEQQQNQDQNQDQQQDQQQQEQDQQQQQNQNQQQDQNQNQDQQQDQNQNQDKKGSNQPRPEDQQQQPQEQQGGVSQNNAQQILKAMEDKENATRRRVEAQKADEERRHNTQRQHDKPW